MKQKKFCSCQYSESHVWKDKDFKMEKLTRIKERHPATEKEESSLFQKKKKQAGIALTRVS